MIWGPSIVCNYTSQGRKGTYNLAWRRTKTDLNALRKYLSCMEGPSVTVSMAFGISVFCALKNVTKQTNSYLYCKVNILRAQSTYLW